MEYVGFEWLSTFMTQSIVVIPIITGLVQVAKLTALPDKYAPLLSLLIGIAIAFIINGVGLSWGQHVIAGIIYGLSASGLYSAGKTLISKTGSEG
jgi:uncharacterized membrane protein (DUF441 family)